MGFSDCKMATARELTEEAKHLEQWLKNNSNGQMSYMENYFDKRIDPTKLVPGTKTVVVFSYNYYPKEEVNDSTYKIARYAYGQDYHRVIKKKLKNLLVDLQAEFGQIEGRYFVDSAPILERDWAKISGIGWIGKNTLTLTKAQGSYYFLATLLLSIDLPPDSPVGDYCGTCTKCIDACPTGAIDGTGNFLHADKCISYLTIELSDSIPTEFKGQLDNWMFGCDICQEVCPWNRFAQPTQEEKFNPSPELSNMKQKDWEEMSRDLFEELFKGTPVKRAGYEKLKDTIRFLETD